MFLRLSKMNVLENYHGNIPILTKRMDFNELLGGGDVLLKDIQIIYGVNSLHAAGDIISTVKKLYNMLGENGSLIISECVREKAGDTLVQEIIFNLLESYTNVKTDKLYRSTPGFLTVDDWIRTFKNAGFSDIESITNNDLTDNNRKIDYPTHAMVLRGVKKKI